MEQRKTRARRLEILTSAAAAFRRRGYHGASMGEIAQALHMTKGSLYYYFKSKEEILFFCHDYSLDILLATLAQVEGGGGSASEKLGALIQAFVHHILDDLRGTAMTLDFHALSAPRLRRIIAKRDRFDRGVRRLLQEGVDAGAFASGETKLLTFAILGALNWIPRWFDPEGPATSDEIGRAFAEYLVRGLQRRR
jgi:TetR/AcrR family transcriptional regulator